MGYGGSSYGLYPYASSEAPDLLFPYSGPGPGGYGQQEYGYSPYGSAFLPRVRVPVSGGYGGSPYGLGPYGTTDDIPPSVSSVISLDGFRVEIFFSEEMLIDAALTDPSSYVFSTNLGAAATTPTLVEVGVQGQWGATSVIVTHSGTTLGGSYTVTVDGPRDLAGNEISELPGNTGTFLAKGDPPTFTATPISGNEILVDFDRDMLPESEFPGGIEDTTEYDFECSYPIQITAQTATHPYNSDDSQVLLTVIGMTSVDYTLTITPAEAIIYDGSYLPDQATEFIGTVVGIGQSRISAGELLLDTYFGNAYGWNFADTSGRIQANSSMRVDISLDASSALYSPALYDTVLGGLYVSDGAVQVGLVLERIGGQDLLTVISGAYSSSVTASWSTSPSTITLVRNQKADTYAILFNGTPVLTVATAFFTGVPTIPPGAQFLLGTAYEIRDFAISSLTFTSSQTIFSAAWNFLHDQTDIFTGFAALGFVNDTLLTQKGPLVKGWGDATPATKQDVEVRVNGTVVEVTDVNPYLGAIRLAIPVPLMPIGTITVEVDYIWFPNPVMDHPGYNDPGGAYNKWDRPVGRHTTSPTNYYGGGERSRFAFSLVYPSHVVANPLQVGHRYIGFQKAYTASYNNPTRLLFNQNPHAIAVQDFNRSPEVSLESFEGATAPTSQDWSLIGVDTGSADNLTGLYTLIDASSGSYGVGTAALYYQEVDLSFDSTVTIAARLWVEESVPDGVFSGVGFGVHNNRRLFYVGLVTVNGLEHVGILLEPARPHEASSWKIGPTTQITIVDSLTLTATTAELPISLEVGDQFQILSGNQAGVYTIELIINQTDGSTTITLESSTPFPANPKYWSNDTAEAVWEFPWTSTPASYRLVVRPSDVLAELFASGENSSLAISVDRVPEVSVPADSTLTLSTEGKGQVFWGSISRPATNQSVWSFFRYGNSPDQTTIHSRGVVVSSEMAEDPQDDPNSEWFLRQEFGFAWVDTSGSNLLLKSNVADPQIDLRYGYARVEPFFLPKANADIDVGFKVESQTGFADTVVSLFDTNREIRLGTLAYLETSTRFLIDCPLVSMCGLRTPTVQGWSESTSSTLTYFSRGKLLEIAQGLGDTGGFDTDLDLSSLLYADEGGRIIEARFAVLTYTADGSGRTGLAFGGNAGLSGAARTVRLTLMANPFRVALILFGGALQEYTFDWSDGEQHDYRILVDAMADTVTLVIDDVVQVPTIALSSLETATDNTEAFFGSLGYSGTAWSCEWESMASSVLPPSLAKRTLGIWLGGDVSDINSWEIPRTDSTSFDNSSLSAVVEEMDWRSLTIVRIRRDASWGVTVFRPDLPPPPYFTGDFATQITEPDAGWINVEYPNLPRSPRTFGLISFGALSSTAITQQRWDYARYRIYTHVDNDYRSPCLMVYNQYNVITSGELTRDETLEEITVWSTDTTHISLRAGHITANMVYKVIETDSGKVHLYESWSFDPETQIITLDDPLPSSVTSVTVIFSPGKPVTITYLEEQPLEGSVTLLNEDTPPIPKSQLGEPTRRVLYGTMFNDPNVRYGVPDFVYNDPYRYVEFVDEEASLYEKMSFLTLDNSGQTGLLSPFCDTSFPGHGLIEIGLEGFMFTDTFGGPGSALMGPTWNTSDVMIWAGGSSTWTSSWAGTGTVDGGGSMWPPSYLPDGTKTPGSGMGGLNKTFELVMTLTGVLIDVLGNVEQDLIEDFSLSPTADNVPPSYTTDPDLVPDGVPGVHSHGACLAVLEDQGTSTSRWAPWGDIFAMEASSTWYGASASQPSGTPPSGVGMTWAGGSPLPPPTITVIPIEAAN